MPRKDTRDWKALAKEGLDLANSRDWPEAVPARTRDVLSLLASRVWDEECERGYREEAKRKVK
jgi:hypothetical protein